MKRSRSAAATLGPRSLISVCSPEVGSTIERFVRESPATSTKSWRTCSASSSSRIRAPVGPAAKPVAITGLAEALQGAGDVDPLAAGGAARVDHAMAVAERAPGVPRPCGPARCSASP